MPLSRNFNRLSDRFYSITVFLGRFPLWCTSRPLVIDAHHARRSGPFILASNHFSHYDFLALMRSTPRHLDFVSIIEAFRIPFVGWLFAHMNAFPLDRHNRDPQAVRVILDRLAAGRVIAMYPEAGLRNETNSACVGGPFRPGVARLARLAGVPIIPAVVYGTTGYNNWVSFIPWVRRVHYGVIYGEAIDTSDEKCAEEQLRQAFQTLYQRLRSEMAGKKIATDEHRSPPI